MAQGYLVRLENGRLDSGDAVKSTDRFFVADETIGHGSWTWSGSRGSSTYSNVTEAGSYVLGSNGNVYFVPDGPRPDSIDEARAAEAPDYDHATYGSSADDEVSGREGDDDIYGGADRSGIATGDDTLAGNDGDDAIFGGDGDDLMCGGDGADLMFGGVGNDALQGGAGDDQVYGDAGDDSIFGGAGDDRLNGGIGDDKMQGGLGADVMIGAEGRDVMQGDAGDDTLFGGDDGDALYGGDGDDNLRGDGGDDTLVGGAGRDEMRGGSGDDGLFGGTEADWMFGDDGDDKLDGGAGDDAMSGGDGDDRIYGGTGSDDISGDAGDDSIEGGAGDDALRGGGDDDIIFGGDGDDLVFGQFGDDDVHGDEGADTVYGGRGHDTASGGAGDDYVSGRYGDDTLFGGAGDDTLYGDIDEDGAGARSIGIFALDASGNGDATGFSGTYGFDGNAARIDVEALDDDGHFEDYDSTGGSPLDSGSLPQTLSTDATINGRDYAAGTPLHAVQQVGLENLTTGETGHAWLVQIGGDGGDRFWAFDVTVADGDQLRWTAGPDAEDVSGLDYSMLMQSDGRTRAIGDDSLSGGDGNDTLFGAQGDDSLSGDAGDDAVFGGAGDDVFLLDDDFGIDTITGGETDETRGDTLDASAMTDDARLMLQSGDPEAGTLEAGPGNSASFSEIEHVILGSGDDSVTGSDGDDDVALGAGADRAEMGAGDDRLDLGGDDDTDVVVFGDGDGDDVLLHFEAPVSDGFGGWTGRDLVDVGGLTDADGQPVTTADVTVGDDGDGNVVLGFPGGESLTLIGVPPSALASPAQLAAIGIPTDGVVEGTSGADLIDLGYIGDPDGDRVDAGDAADGSDDDVIRAGDGDDMVRAGSGDDSAAGGLGDDEIHGGAGDDTLSGNDGDDFVFGGADDDTLYGNDGDDGLTGGLGADTGFGGFGADTIIFAEGDSVDGGGGDDLFVLEDLGEPENGTITVVGGNDDETDGDTLQLGSLAQLSTLSISSTSDSGSMAGSVLLDDGTQLNFSEIENIICFTPGTRIATPHGARPVEDLRIGDRVLTRDHGLQPLRWIGRRTVPALGSFAPIRLRPGVLTGLESDLVVSPQHRMLFRGYRAELLFGDSEVLVAAAHLVDGQAVTRDPGGMVTYIHLMFDDHEVIYAEGAATESFHPGAMGLSALDAGAREELFALFPELRAMPASYGPTARRCLKRHEASLIRV